MELYRPRSSSMPRKRHRVFQEERFSVADAAQLKLKLQHLDNVVASISPAASHVADIKTDMRKGLEAYQPRPSDGAAYVDGSEEFYLVVKSLSRPDLIPDVYVEAYTFALYGHPYVNAFRVSDFKKGVDPTFSQIRPFLKNIDSVCNTNLAAAYQSVEAKVKPFPFLRLPAELRLHVYSHVLPRESHIALLFQPTREHKPPRLALDVMRANKQLHDEATRYLYENRALFMIAARDKDSPNLSNEFMSRPYEVLANMNPQTRKLFKTLEVQAGYLSHQEFLAKRYPDIPSVSNPIEHIFSLLPNLSTLVISFGAASKSSSTFQEKSDTMTWLVDYAPESVDIIWDLAHARPLRGRLEEQPLWQTIQTRGSIRNEASVTTRLSGPAKSFWANRFGQ